ncbi:hypothetical protein ACFQYP_50820 [Nonomuraea antimicrobica]
MELQQFSLAEAENEGGRVGAVCTGLPQQRQARDDAQGDGEIVADAPPVPRLGGPLGDVAG